jgi:hypothetical protein
MTKSKLPVKIKECLLGLTPKQEVAVLSYLDRGSPGFGNKTRAKKIAGYAESTSGTAVFSMPEVQIALRELRTRSLELAEEVMSDIRALAPEAADELMAQLRVGRDMEILDATQIFGKNLTDVSSREDADRLRSVSAYNATVAKLMKERRVTAETILAYGFGTPEQRVRVAHGEPQDELDRMLGSMTKESFERLGSILFGDTKKGPEDEDDLIPVVEAELLD